MKYTVDWEPGAVAALAAIWLQAANRQAVTAAQDEIDRLLAADPQGNGTAIVEGLYAIDAYPLRAQFKVSDAQPTVRVVAVAWLI
ncbi:MAG: hypothetical protein JNM56_40565 [Planctomycetia bacterium]|nr:hypothetical protein [Planctomycetia bacterium]